jgi:hypothetical protein
VRWGSVAVMDGPTSPRAIERGLASAGAARPLLLGLAGDSASGKSTLSRGVEYVLGLRRVARLCTDDYHRFDRADRARLGVTPLDPAANTTQAPSATTRRSSRARSSSWRGCCRWPIA